MNTLLMDTHDKKVIFVLYDGLQIKKMETQEEKNHSNICIPKLKEFLEKNNLSLTQITDIIIVNGPGSFTGVRLGVTIAKTMAYCLNIPIRAISTLEQYLPYQGKEQFLAIPEKNGYFVGKLNASKNEIIKYEYLTKEEVYSIEDKIKQLTEQEIDYEKLINLTHQKEPINPHQVNPFYVKKIEVEK